METKRLFTILLLLLTSTFCFSAKLCKGFVKEGRVWNLSKNSHIDSNYRWIPDGETYSYTIMGDTIIDGDCFKKLFIKDYEEYEDEKWHYYGALQEVDRKVFFVEKDSPSRYLLFDFGIDESNFCPVGNESTNLGDISCFCDLKLYIEIRNRIYNANDLSLYSDSSGESFNLWSDCFGIQYGDPFKISKWIGYIFAVPTSTSQKAKDNTLSHPLILSVYDGSRCIATREDIDNAKKYYEYFPAHIDSNYFPTGMEWEETSVDLGQEEDNASSITHYEIGEETTVDEQLYRKVLIDGAESNLLIREDGSEVWLLTNEYPDEIKLYDFDWEKNETLQSEFLIKKNGEWILEEQEMQPEYKQTTVDTRDYEYHQDADLNTIVRGIGRVADRSKNSCLLGYKEPETILPGQTYNKVTWVKRMGEEIFRSDDGEEWITYIPGSPETSIPDAGSLTKSKSGSGKTYTIGGQQTKASRRGIYIRDGEKFVVK